MQIAKPDIKGAGSDIYSPSLRGQQQIFWTIESTTVIYINATKVNYSTILKVEVTSHFFVYHQWNDSPNAWFWTLHQSGYIGSLSLVYFYLCKICNDNRRQSPAVKGATPRSNGYNNCGMQPLCLALFISLRTQLVILCLAWSIQSQTILLSASLFMQAYT